MTNLITEATRIQAEKDAQLRREEAERIERARLASERIQQEVRTALSAKLPEYFGAATRELVITSITPVTAIHDAERGIRTYECGISLPTSTTGVLVVLKIRRTESRSTKQHPPIVHLTFVRDEPASYDSCGTRIDPRRTINAVQAAEILSA